jgi:DNA topoisomerase IB
MANKETVGSEKTGADHADHPKNPLRQRRTKKSDMAIRAGFRSPSNKGSKVSLKKKKRRKSR